MLVRVPESLMRVSQKIGVTMRDEALGGGCRIIGRLNGSMLQY